MAKTDLKRRWEPNEAALQRLLAWLDQGADSEGQCYVELRERLVLYFARRNGPAPEDLADETLNRVARRLEETGSIDDIVPARYCYIVAKFVLLEALRQRGRQVDFSSGDHEVATQPRIIDEAAAEHERAVTCLERCLAECAPSDRQLILDYYRTDSGSASAQRKLLAGRLGLTANSLAIRACRIRSRLERCVRLCRQR